MHSEAGWSVTDGVHGHARSAISLHLGWRGRVGPWRQTRAGAAGILVAPGEGSITGSSPTAALAVVGSFPRWRNMDRCADGRCVVGDKRLDPSRSSTKGNSSALANEANRPVGGRKLQWIALVLGIPASIATIVGLVISFSGSSGSQQNGAESAAAQVRTCMTYHHLSQAQPTIPVPAPSQLVIASCAWPPPPGADQDGFTAIDVTTVPGPGQDEASDATEIDRITSPCTRIQLIYTNGSQGKSSFVKFTVPVPTITSMDSEPAPWSGSADQLSFDPGPNEVDYIRSNVQSLSGATCVS